MFLYLLKFKNKELMKIGIAKNYGRIETLKNVYNDIAIDFDNSKIVTAKNKRDIVVLEKQLLQDYCDHLICNDFVGRDGHTELRDVSIFDLVVRDIEEKAFKFPSKEFTIQKIETPENVKNKPVRRSKEELKQIRIEKTKQKTFEARKIALNFIECVEQRKNCVSDICFDEYGQIKLEFQLKDYTREDFQNENHLVGFPLGYSLDVIGGYNLTSGASFREETKVLSISITMNHLLRESDKYRWELKYTDLIWFTKKLFKVLGIKFDYYGYIEQSKKEKIVNRSIWDCEFVEIVDPHYPPQMRTLQAT